MTKVVRKRAIGPKQETMEEIRDSLVRRVRDLPQEALPELAAVIKQLEDFYFRPGYPVPPESRTIQ